MAEEAHVPNEEGDNTKDWWEREVCSLVNWNFGRNTGVLFDNYKNKAEEI